MLWGGKKVSGEGGGRKRGVGSVVAFFRWPTFFFLPFRRKRTGIVKEVSVMSAEYAGKRQRGGGDGRPAAVFDPAKTSATSSADLESMLKQALCRIDSLEKQHEQIKVSMERETRTLRDDIVSLKGEENKAIQASAELEIEALRDEVEALKSENKALKWSLDRLARKVREDWEYPVAIQPSEYWRSKGYEDEAIYSLKEYFFDNLERAVSELEHGVCDHVTVGCVDHDEALMPHWNALFRCFQHINPHDAGVELCIQSIELNEEVMRRICYFVRNMNISQVDFSHNQFTNWQRAISELGNALKSSKLRSFTWSGNRIETTEDMTLLTRVLSQKHTALDELLFTGNGNENAQALLSGVDFSTYKILGLSWNNLQTNGRTDIPDLIAKNPPLLSLYLGGNRLNDDDAVLIAQSLGGNTHLKDLEVENNNIRERGMRALYEAVNDTSTLNALSDSNHSCCLFGLSNDFDLEAINSKQGSDRLQMNRMCKIHKLMTKRYRNGDGNVPHLNIEMSGEDSVLLAPFVMESVVRRHDAFRMSIGNDIGYPQNRFECSMGLLYELVKDWKMTELFSFR